jgi:hypothetical protein
MPKQTQESRIKAAILTYLLRHGLYVWNNPSGAVQIRPGQFMRFGKVGSADIIGCLPGGRFIAVEVKAPKGQLSDQQAEFLARIKNLGGLAIVARGTKDVEAALIENGYVKERFFDFGKN